MTKEATDLMAAALRIAKVDGSFSPADVGAKIGLSRGQSELAARALANAGVLVLGFDYAAHFSSDFKKSQRGDKAAAGKPRGKKRRAGAAVQDKITNPRTGTNRRRAVSISV